MAQLTHFARPHGLRPRARSPLAPPAERGHGAMNFVLGALCDVGVLATVVAWAFLATHSVS